VRVADLNASDGTPAANDRGVLANLPRTRPQRATPRRAAARTGEGAPPTASRRRTRSTTPRARAAARPRSAARPEDAVPVQGFECESEATSGSVQPPGAVELVASLAEVVSELAKAGASRGERLLRELTSRLPGS
jgi:hypothetical protein